MSSKSSLIDEANPEPRSVRPAGAAGAVALTESELDRVGGADGRRMSCQNNLKQLALAAS
jgi:hypothetical protein